VTRTTDPESEIAVHTMTTTANLVFQRLGGSGERLGVRHLENRGHATPYGCERTGFEIFLVFKAGLAEMDLAIHHTWQNMQAGAVNHLACCMHRKRTYGSDATIANTDVALAYTVVIDDGCTLQNRMEC